jgi:hypothetical protein
MNAPLAMRDGESLPTLIDRATSALASARTSAEVLEARDMARVAYDAAKSAARIIRAKEAHDSLIADVHRAQAHALNIRARAEMRLAEEYDAAQERGEVAKIGDNLPSVAAYNAKPATAAVLGIRRDEIHEARRLRDADRAEPGIVERTLNGMIERGEEPTRAALHREVIQNAKPVRVMDPAALWLWGRLKDFERDGILARSPRAILAEMTEPMRADVRRLLPMVRDYLSRMETDQ